MKIKISDLMDCIQDDSVLIQQIDIASSEKIKEAAMRKIHEESNISDISRRKRTSKASVILIAAVLTVAALAGAAIASGYDPSIFGARRDLGPVTFGEDYEKTIRELDEIDAHSNREEVDIALSGIDGGRFKLSQSYYDGERLLLGYSLDALRSPADFSFDPGNEKFIELFHTTSLPRVIPFVEFGADGLTADERDRLTQTLRDTGKAGVIFTVLYVGDHITLEDGTDIGPHSEIKLDNGVFLEFDTPLADAARNQSELKILVSVRSATWYYYQDEAAVYYLVEPVETILVPLTIAHSGG